MPELSRIDEAPTAFAFRWTRSHPSRVIAVSITGLLLAGAGLYFFIIPLHLGSVDGARSVLAAEWLVSVALAACLGLAIGWWRVDRLARDRAENALSQSQARFDAVVGQTNALVRVAASDGSFPYLSRGWLSFTGKNSGEISAQEWEELIHPDDRPVFVAAHRRAALNREPVELEYRVRRADGHYRWVLDASAPCIDHAGSFQGSVCSTIDITERKRTEEALRRSEDRFRLAFENAPIGIALLSPDGRWIKVNPALCEQLAYSIEEFMIADYRSMTAPDDLDAEGVKLRALLRNETASYEIEKRFIHKSGREVWAHVSAAILRDPAGKPESVILQISDINGRKSAEQRLQSSLVRQEELLRREQSLLRELDHRVRNNLSSLLGLVRLYDRSGRTSEELSAAIKGKIEAMRAVHEVISSTRGKPVALAELVSSLTRDQLPGDRRELIEIVGPPIWVSAAQAGPLAIIIQELFTNSCKHGALTSPLGTISVRWQLRPSGTGQGYVVIWQEAGGPLVVQPRKAGVGLTLIQGFSESDLQGTCRFLFDPKGFQCVISVGDAALQFGATAS